MNVIPDLVLWLYERLAADTALLPLLTSPDNGELRVYEKQDGESRASGYVPIWPANPHYPAVRFEILDVPHTNGNGGRRFASHPLVLIEGIDRAEDVAGGALEAIAGRIDALFGSRATGQKNRLAISGSIGVEDYTETENGAGGVYKHLGGTYQFFVFTFDH
jgi:hypothetical protein